MGSRSQSAVIAALVGTVLCRAASAEAAAAPGASVAATPPAGVPARPSGRLEEIVVTAQKRSQRLQKVPATITAFSGKQLAAAHVTGFAGLQNVVVGLEFGENAANGSQEVSIRGVAPLPDFPGQDPVVAFHVDGVYNARPAAATGLFYDIDRVEVLSGPQGTLYGRNSTAGAINVITAKPADTYQADAEVGVGNYGLVRSSGMVNLPVVPDKLEIRIAGQQESHGGYINNGEPTESNDASDLAGRIHVLFTPTENFSALLSGDFFHETGEGSQEVPLCNFRTADPWHVGTDFNLSLFPSCVPTGTPYYTNYGAPLIPSINSRNYGGSGTFTYNLPAFQVTDIVAERIVDFYKVAKISGAVGYTTENSKEFTNEIRLSSNPGDRLKWVGGIFYFNEHQTADTAQGDPFGYLFGPNYVFGQPADPTNPISNPYGPGAVEHLVDNNANTSSVAGYEQATYPVLPWLRLTEGLRYTTERKTAVGSVYFSDAAGVPLFTPDPFRALAKSNAVNWKLGVDADIAPASMVYFNAGTGYKSGGFSEVPQDTGNPDSYAPQKVLAFEIGSKNRFLDDRLQVNVDAFSNRYVNFQTFEAIPVSDSRGNFFFEYPTINIGSAQFYGVEGSVTFNLTASDRFDLGVNYLDATYGHAIIQGVNVTGSAQADAPHWAGNLAYQHVWHFGSGASASAFVQTHYRGRADMQQQPSDRLNYQNAYTDTTLGISYSAPHDRWHCDAYVKNVENAAVISLASSLDNGTIAPPRTYGVNCGVRFR